MSAPDFYLASSEGYDLEEPRSCWRLRRMRTPHRDDLLLVQIAPPLIGQTYGLGDQDIHCLLLATRQQRASLFPVAEWPTYVYIARPLVDDIETRDELADSEFKLIAWGEIYRTEEEAQRKGV